MTDRQKLVDLLKTNVESVEVVTSKKDDGTELKTDTSQITLKEGTLDALLPEGLDSKTVKKVISHMRDITTAMIEATSNISLENKNGFADKSIEKVTMTLPVSSGSRIEATTVRSRTTPENPGVADGKTKEHFAQTAGKIKISASGKTDIQEINQKAHASYEAKFKK